MVRILCVFLFCLSSTSFAAMSTDEYMDDLINRAQSNPSSLTAADRSALSVYNTYKKDDNSQVKFARRYAAHVRNFFTTRIGNASEMPPDRSSSLQVFLSRNPQEISLTEGRGFRKVKDEADVVAKDYNARECIQNNQGPCDLLDEREQDVLARVKRVARIKDAIENGPERVVRSAVNATTQVARNIGEGIRRMGEATSHIIQCEVSPPEYKNCVTADGVTYVRSDNQAITNIRNHVDRTRGSRNTFNQQRNTARGQ